MLHAATISELKSQYNGLKIEYLKAVLNGNPDKEITELEQLITIGTKIGENTTKYKSELNRLKQVQASKQAAADKQFVETDAQASTKEETPTASTTQEPSSEIQKPEEKQEETKSSSMQVETVEPRVQKNTFVPNKSSKFSIDSIVNDENSIIINFNKMITANDIKAFELNDTKTHRSVFDITGTYNKVAQTKLKIDGIQRISVGQFKANVVRITLANNSLLETAYSIQNNTLIIKIMNLSATNQNSTQKLSKTTKQAKKEPIKEMANESESNQAISKFTNPNSKKQRTIVIDPGHGGKDAGAVGPENRYEKNVVFDVSTMLYEILKSKGYAVHLTRKDDTFIELKERTKLSNDKNADIFVSIHVNAIAKEKADTHEGIETFFLSPARSERAKRVAALENESDMDAMNNNSQMTFLTVLNQSKITASNKLAIDIQQNLLYSARKSYKDIVDSGVREGPFWVLVGAQMPSVLVELGYISHPKESDRLVQKNYQKQLAIGLANGIDAYFSKNDY
jgi:N-acetylmuramoyl-L-alanine amidase